MAKKQRNLFDELEGTALKTGVGRKVAGLHADSSMDQMPVDPFKQPLPSGVLSLDIATNTGFCTSTASGSWNLTPKKDESKGMRLIRFRAKIKEVCALENIRLIVFEQMAVYSKFPNFIQAEMIGVLKLFCEENGIEYKSYPPTILKKWATGKGGAKKEMMIEAANKYKPGIEDDDEADAVLLFHMALTDLHL